MSAKIAIIGSGPSGFYAADTFAKKLPECHIDIIDRLPTPFGLVRAGVAPDHQMLRIGQRRAALFDPDRRGISFASSRRCALHVNWRGRTGSWLRRQLLSVGPLLLAVHICRLYSLTGPAGTVALATDLSQL